MALQQTNRLFIYLCFWLFLVSIKSKKQVTGHTKLIILAPDFFHEQYPDQKKVLWLKVIQAKDKYIKNSILAWGTGGVTSKRKHIICLCPGEGNLPEQAKL